MSNNNLSEVMQSLFKGMDSVLSTKTVVGEPTQIGDVIILPLVDVSFGVAAGAALGDSKNNGGGGLGGKMSPNAVLVIKDGTTKLVNIKNQDTITKVLDMVPDLVDKITNKEKEPVMPSDEEVVDVAFGENKA